MKSAIFVFSIFLAACMGEQLASMIKKEVHVLMQADGNMTVPECTSKCDNLFDLVDPHDEDRTDLYCHYFCTCETYPADDICHHQAGHHTTVRPTRHP